MACGNAALDNQPTGLHLLDRTRILAGVGQGAWLERNNRADSARQRPSNARASFRRPMFGQVLPEMTLPT